MSPSVSVFRRVALLRRRRRASDPLVGLLFVYLSSSACSLQAPKEDEVFGSQGGSSSLQMSGGTGGSGEPSSSSGRQGSSGQGAGASTGGSGGTRSGSDEGGSPITPGGVTGASGGSTSGTSGETGSGGAPAPDIERGLVAHYAFEETSGDSVVNTVSASASGKCFGTCLHLSGTMGGAIGLRNSEENLNWVELPSGLLSGMSATTLSLWVRDLSASRKDAPAFHFSRGTNEVFFFVPDDVVPDTSTSSGSLGVKHGGAQIISIRGTRSLTDRSWHHVAATWTAAAVSLYIDGMRIGTQSSPGAVPDDLGPTSPNYLGRALSDTIPAINADLDELRIYDRALEAEELNLLYRQPSK
ncbi:MAG TPA: LamG domain-containing protein [Polyangiaceae bacterium]|nr:LamG domain-containing protein [Polyangiaceae bacterium]